jgi:hypothetical protein
VGRRDQPRTCDVCHTGLNPVLVKHGYARHPCCDPDEVPWSWCDGTLNPDPRPWPPLPDERPGHAVPAVAPYRKTEVIDPPDGLF